MQEGYSTAPEWIRGRGFGAGMGLPNMRRNSDELTVDSEPGRGTRVTIVLALSGAPVPAGASAAAGAPSEEGVP